MQSGTELYYGQPVVDVCADADDIQYITISTKSGLKHLSAKIYIDCTGDGDVAAWAGAEFVCGDKFGRFQPGTLRYYPAVKVDDNILDYGDNTNHVALNTVDSDSITVSEIEARNMIYEQIKI